MLRALTNTLSILALLAVGIATTNAQSPSPTTSPTPTVSSSRFGAYPANYQEIITDWLNEQLYNRADVKVKWLGEPKPTELPGEGGQKIAGYFVEFTVNARNRFGTYTGDQRHGALIQNGQVVKATGFGYR